MLVDYESVLCKSAGMQSKYHALTTQQWVVALIKGWKKHQEALLLVQVNLLEELFKLSHLHKWAAFF